MSRVAAIARSRSQLAVVIVAALAAAALTGCGSDNGSDQAAKQKELAQVRADARRQARREERIKELERRVREADKPQSSTSGSPGSSAPAPAAANGSRCAASALRVISSGGQGAAGTQFAALRFELRGPGRCTLSGYPGVTLLNGAQRFNTDVGRYRLGQSRTVQVDARHPAYFDLVYRNTASGRRPRMCDTRVSALSIIPPDDRQALPVTLRPGPVSLCLDSVSVQAVRSTSAP